MITATQNTARRLASLLAAVCLAFVVFGPGSAAADQTMQDWKGWDGAFLDSAGAAETQAGSVPHSASTSIVIKFASLGLLATASPLEQMKSAIVDLPPGLVGNPQAIPTCSIAELASGSLSAAAPCPLASQVGYVVIYFPQSLGTLSRFYSPLFNVGAQLGSPGVFAFNFAGVLVYASAHLRNGEDYGVTFTSANAPVGLKQPAIDFVFWGAPQDPSHDLQRGYFNSGNASSCASPAFAVPPNECPPHPVTADNNAFISLPTSCSGPLAFGLALDSWENSGDYVRSSFLTHEVDPLAPIDAPSGMEGCNTLTYTGPNAPSIEARPTTNVADSASGLDVDLHTPQNSDVHGTAEPHLKDAVVTLPEGLVVNPSQANGLGACTLSEYGFSGYSNEVQTISLPAIGPFSLTFDGQTTAMIPANSGAAAVQAALEALANVGAGNVAVSGDPQAYKVEFTGALANTDVPQISAEGLSDEVDRVAVDATGGAYRFTYGASNSTVLSAAPLSGAQYGSKQPQARINQLASVTSAGGSVTTIGGPPNAGATRPFYVTFSGGNFAGTDQVLTATSISLSGGAATVTVTEEQKGGQPVNGIVSTTQEAGSPRTTPDPADCPDASRLGDVEVETPLLDKPLKGSVFLAEPFENPFDSLLALYISLADTQTGIVVKLAGEVELDPSTGRIKATFEQNPQLPFEHFRLHFFGGSAGALRTPTTCGTYETTSSLTPWSAPESGPPATPNDSWAIEQAPGGGTCPTSQGEIPNSPDLDAGSVSPVAAASTPTVVNLRRNDGTQEFSKVDLKLPPGLTGKLVGVGQCSDAALASAASKSGNEEKASPSCPADSRIGTVDVAAGAGPAPYNAQGTAYLTGSYKGAPLGMAIVTPATAGPFDLGTVVVRVALHVDRNSAQITAISDEIPTILEGIPLDIRSAKVTLDRPDFTRNGTSCNPSSFEGNLVSTLNQSASLSERFQLGECSALGFKPKLGIRLIGGTKRGGHPALRATLQMPEGGANIARTVVALPRSEFLDQGNIITICTRVQFAAKECPEGSIYGAVVATSPLVDYPLEGNVYLRASDNELPDLVMALHGPPSQPIEVDVVGRIDSIKGGIRTTFESTPDLPVSGLVLNMQGGKNKGLLENSTNICKGKHKATAEFDGQNGKESDFKILLKNGKCGKSGKAKKRKAARRNSR